MSAKNVLRYFDKINTEEKAYWLGFLYADGSISSKEDKIELGLAEKDLHHIEKFKQTHDKIFLSRVLNIHNSPCGELVSEIFLKSCSLIS